MNMYCISAFSIIHFSRKWIFERLCWITGPCRTIQKDTMFISMKHLVGCWNWYVTYFQVSFIWTDKCPFMEILFIPTYISIVHTIPSLPHKDKNSTPENKNCMETRYQIYQQNPDETTRKSRSLRFLTTTELIGPWWTCILEWYGLRHGARQCGASG